MSPEKLRILYDEKGLVVVDKPPGLPTTGRDLDEPACVQHLLMRRLGAKVWAVHQLDKDTSGVNLFVTRRSLVETWAKRLAQGTKTYLAVCHGAPGWEEKRVDLPLAYSARRGRQVPRKDGKPATTRFRVLARAEGFSLVEARIATGRTHQVRVHLAHLGHPLVGERLYRRPPSELSPRHLLHAFRVTLPVRPSEIVAPPTPDFLEWCARLGLILDEEALFRLIPRRLDRA